MSDNTKKWIIRFLDLLSVALPLLIGLSYIVISLAFRNFGGVPDTAEDTKKATAILLIGVALVLSALLLPLKSKRRFYTSFGIVSVSMLYGILPKGQEDQTFFFILYIVAAPALYLVKQKVKRTN